MPLVAIFDAHDEWHGEALHETLVHELEAHSVVGGHDAEVVPYV